MRVIWVLFFSLLGSSVFGSQNLAAKYSFDKLEEASTYVRLQFDAKKDFCKIKSEQAPQIMQSLKAIIDVKIREEFVLEPFDGIKFSHFLKKASKTCSCFCGVYSYIYEQLNTELSDELKKYEVVYQVLEQKNKKINLQKQVKCTAKTAKWLCHSPLLKAL